MNEEKYVPTQARRWKIPRITHRTAPFIPLLNLLAATTALFAALVACAPSAQSSTLTVYAAASLRDAFTALGRDFQAQNPGIRVEFSFAGSQQLAEQIGHGAPADVFASANARLMDAVVKTGRVTASAPRIFARNRLVVVFPQQNPARLRSLQDLARKNTSILLANKAAPVGAYSLDFLAKAAAQKDFGPTWRTAVLSNVVSYEEDVRAVFAKVSLGEADAGIVYASDIVADRAKTVGVLEIPAALNTIAAYPIAPLTDSPNPALARAFVDFVLSPDGQATLAKYGFAAR
jgi:molybdate transport system substrate-binding protein